MNCNICYFFFLLNQFWKNELLHRILTGLVFASVSSIHIVIDVSYIVFIFGRYLPVSPVFLLMSSYIDIPLFTAVYTIKC